MASPPHILLIKEKGVAPTRSSKTVYQVFAFNSKVEVFNNFFRHNMMNRFQVDTKTGETPFAGISHLLDVWAKSKYPDDTLCDSTLPMPNTKDYVWRDVHVNKTIQDERWKLTNDRSRSRKRMDLHQLQLKEKMFHDLVSSPCFVVEMREDTLNAALKKSGVHLTHQFILERKVNQSVIDKTDISTQRTELNFIGALKEFSFMRVSLIHSHLKKRTRIDTTFHLDEDEDADYYEDEDDDEDDNDDDDDNNISHVSSMTSSPSNQQPIVHRRTNPKRQATEQQGSLLFSSLLFYFFCCFLIPFLSLFLGRCISPNLSGFIDASSDNDMVPSPLERSNANQGNGTLFII